ncbi:MAG: DUF4145 domain-containing protein [Protaetiibacter sp.]
MATPEPRGERPPARGMTAFDCPVCGAFAQQHWGQLVEWDPEEGARGFVDGPGSVEHDEGRFPRLGGNVFVNYREPTQEQLYPGQAVGEGDEELPESAEWAFARCARCSFVTIWRGDRLIYPAASRMPHAHPDMPDDARSLYEEAREVFAVSPRAGAALARAALERLLRTIDQDAPARATLEVRIDRVLAEVSQPLGKMLTVIRHVGNESLHVQDEPDELTLLVLSDEQTENAELLFAAINGLVEELITKPAAYEALYDRAPQNVRDRVERARSAKDPKP